jgi:hypothetical protein
VFGGFCLLFLVHLFFPFRGGLFFDASFGVLFDDRISLIVNSALPLGEGFLFGEFDSGSGRTLAACLTHASRTERPFGVLEWRTGE